MKILKFAAAAALAAVSTGTVLVVHCDGCPPDLNARVSYVSADPEFTPPVIYSLEARQKLVYRVEARPETGALLLKPGQIVDVEVREEANSE